MKKFLLLCVWAGLTGSLSAQMYYDDGRLIYGGDSTLQGSYQALGINPSNLGRANSFRTSAGFLQFGGNFRSEGLNLTQLLSLGLSDQAFDSSLRSSLVQQNLTPSENFGYDGNLDMTWGAFSIASPGLGGLAISVQDRLASSAEIPNPFFGVLLQGTDAPAFDNVSNVDSLTSIGDGTRVSFSHLRSLRIGYGRKIISIDDKVTLYGGATLQYLWGIGYYQADVSGGRFNSLASFSEAYRIDYGSLNVQDPSDQRRLLSNSGRGWAVDIGASLDIGKKINVGVALVDIGGLTWNKNVVAAEADFNAILDSVKSGLINSYGLNQEVGNVYDLVEETPAESFQTTLNTHARLNASYRLLPRLIVGADLVVPFRNGDLNVVDRDAGVLTTTLSWAIIPKVVNFSSGLIYSPSFGYRLPAGVAIGFGKAALSITTADLLTFMSNRDPVASLSVALITGIH
jgi:hypothetical protein